MSFRDHFSRRADAYARYRPTYPKALYERLAALAPAAGWAWDCATGSGQAALGLAARFRRVLATDGSQDQLRRAGRHPRVIYLRALAASSPCGATTC